MTLTRRRVLALTAATLAVPRGLFAADPPPAWRIQRLSWAGLRVEGGQSSLFIDPWINTAIWDGNWKKEVVPLEASTARRSVLVTHLHNDHFDPAALRQLIGESGQVICLDRVAPGIASRGFRVRAVPEFQPERWGDFVVLPVPAEDGFGEMQVSWVVTHGERRLIHCGDSMWHGRLDLLGRAYGPFDLAFLPVNGAIVDNEQSTTGLPRTLTPRQAVVAAKQLRAKTLVPIHYGFSDDTYHEHKDALGELRTVAAESGVTLRVVEEGAWL